MRHGVHTIRIHTVTGSMRDAEGRATNTVSLLRVKGLAALQSDAETFHADQQSRTVRIAVQVPPDTQVFSQDELDVAGTGELLLDGHYQVIEMRATRYVKRLICERYEP